MAKKGNDRRRQKRQAERARRRQRRERKPDSHLRPVSEPGPGDFLAELSTALADPDPVAFLAIASTMAHVIDPRGRNPLDPDPHELDPGEFVDMLVNTPARETTALLHAFSALLPDELLAAKARREARRRPFPAPAWLTRLGKTTVTATSKLSDLLGDGENINVSVRFTTGEELTAVVYVDHNMGTAAKDGFLVPGGTEHLKAVTAEIAREDPRSGEVTALSPADARARISDAIAMGAMTFPPLETESWPGARPLVEWIARLLPEGGTGYEHRERNEAEKRALAEEFLASPEAAGLTNPDDQAIAENLLWFTIDYSGGDPLRWSPINVKILMTDWFTRKILADRAYLLRMPAVLEAFIRYSFRLRGLSDPLLAATVGTVAEMTPEYTARVRDGEGRPSWLEGVSSEDLEEILEEGDMDALLGALGLPGGAAGQAAWGRQWAARMVGGEDALERLTPDPLPQEEFAWEGIAEDIRPRVAQILALCDACAEALFDPEYRTAFRRVLARTAASEPAVFRRRSRNETAAAAIAWVVASANERLNPIGDLTTKELLAHFGVSGSVSDRARPFLRALGAPEWQQGIGLTVGTAEVLTSATRERLIADREMG